MAKEVKRMEVECANDGGYVVNTHYHQNEKKGGPSGLGYVEPDQKVFSADDHEALKDHMHKILGLKEESNGKKQKKNYNSEVESKTFERKEKKAGKEEKE